MQASVAPPTHRPARRLSVQSCCSTLPSLNYPRQLALMAAMTNSYLVLHARPVGHKARVEAYSQQG